MKIIEDEANGPKSVRKTKASVIEITYMIA